MSRRFNNAARLVVFMLFLAVAARAAFIGDYSASHWTLTNSNADGSATVDAGGATLTLVGGNNGSGLPGLTDFATIAPASGTVQFQFAYSSLDAPTFDFAGYLLGGAFTQLADTDGQQGASSFTVSAGQSFGFRVGTLDNQTEPGVLVISRFSAPTAVPEPGQAPILVLNLASFAAVHGLRQCRLRASRHSLFRHYGRLRSPQRSVSTLEATPAATGQVAGSGTPQETHAAC